MALSSAFKLAVLALVVSAASARVLNEAAAPFVTGQELEIALHEINDFAKVPDTSAAIAKMPGWSNMIDNLQGPAAEIVEAADVLTTPSADSPDFSADVEALKAFGYQTGSSALSPAGKALYDAYEGVTDYLFSS